MPVTIDHPCTLCFQNRFGKSISTEAMQKLKALVHVVYDRQIIQMTEAFNPELLVLWAVDSKFEVGSISMKAGLYIQVSDEILNPIFQVWLQHEVSGEEQPSSSVCEKAAEIKELYGIVKKEYVPSEAKEKVLA